jgi:hypothetical protein
VRLLWLELNKLATAISKLVIGLFFVIAILNAGTGGMIMLDNNPVRITPLSDVENEEEISVQLLHLQLFGFIHLHQSSHHSHHSEASHGESHKETTGYFLSGSSTTSSFQPFNHDRALAQKIITHYDFAANLAVLQPSTVITPRFIASGVNPIEPFLPVPQRPPTASF